MQKDDAAQTSANLSSELRAGETPDLQSGEWRVKVNHIGADGTKRYAVVCGDFMTGDMIFRDATLEHANEIVNAHNLAPQSRVSEP